MIKLFVRRVRVGRYRIAVLILEVYKMRGSAEMRLYKSTLNTLNPRHEASQFLFQVKVGEHSLQTIT